jgi:hypothetical protein
MPQLQRAPSPVARFGRAEANCHDISNTWLARGYLSWSGTAVPFGLNARQMESWLVHGGGNDLLQEVFASFNCYGIPIARSRQWHGDAAERREFCYSAPRHRLHGCAD